MLSDSASRAASLAACSSRSPHVAAVQASVVAAAIAPRRRRRRLAPGVADPRGLASDPIGGLARRCTLPARPGRQCRAATGIGVLSSRAAFRARACPAHVAASATVGDRRRRRRRGGDLRRSTPPSGEPARLGVVGVAARPPRSAGLNEAAVKVRPADGGLDSVIASLSATLGQAITSLDLTLDKSFMTLPTSCAPAVTRHRGRAQRRRCRRASRRTGCARSRSTRR